MKKNHPEAACFILMNKRKSKSSNPEETFKKELEPYFSRRRIEILNIEKQDIAPFSRLLTNCLKRGLRQFFIFKAGPLSKNLCCDLIPGVIEDRRRSYQDADFHMGVILLHQGALK